jgi:hypothetical protein
VLDNTRGVGKERGEDDDATELRRHALIRAGPPEEGSRVPTWRYPIRQSVAGSCCGVGMAVRVIGELDPQGRCGIQLCGGVERCYGDVGIRAVGK